MLMLFSLFSSDASMMAPAYFHYAAIAAITSIFSFLRLSFLPDASRPLREATLPRHAAYADAASYAAFAMLL